MSKKKRRHYFNKYQDLDLESLSDKDYDEIRSKLVVNAGASLIVGLLVLVIVLAVFFSLSWG